MKNKYISLDDLEKEILKAEDLIITLNNEIEFERKRMQYLNCLYDYLSCDGLCPFTKKELLKDNIQLEFYVAPLLAKQTILESQRDLEIKFGLERIFADKKEISTADIGALLEDFVSFCVELKKGKKFGVGCYHIQKYMDCRKFI